MNSKNYHQKKRFGQHWLVNKKILEKIKEIAVLNENDFILEIGPGKGALTTKLLDITGPIHVALYWFLNGKNLIKSIMKYINI